MELESFVQNLALQFEDIEQSEINPQTRFREIEGWSSLIAFSIIAMVEEEFNVKLKGEDIRISNTIEDLYKIVKSRIQ